MAATGYTSGDPQKVDTSGDTMTGELVLPDSSPDTALAATSRGYVDNATASASAASVASAKSYTDNSSNAASGAAYQTAKSYTDNATTALSAASETRYVNAAGDTMTGRLLMTNGGVDIDVQQAISTATGTGVIYGGEINATPGVTGSVRIGATVGYIVDFITNPADPSFTLVSFAQKDVLLDSNALARATTWLLADTAGNIIQQATRPTNSQRRTLLQLGVVAQASGTIFIDQSLPVTLRGPVNQIYDLMYALGSFNISGNALAPASTNLQLQKSVGSVFVPASNYYDGPTRTNDPHVSPVAAQNPVSIRYVTSVPAAPTAAVTSVIPGSYDVGGVVTAIPGGANVSTIQRVFLIPANATADQVLIQYGSTTYTSLDNAIAAVATDPFTISPNLVDAILIGYIVVTKSATNLASTTQARIFGSSKFGNQPAGGSGLAILTAYALLSGATFTGPVILNADPATALGAATKQYVDASAGTPITTASLRVTDDDLSGLPAAASWTPVVTTGGTTLRCKIDAAVGDRIKVYGMFLYVGSHFLDWVRETSAGAPSQYAASGTSTPAGEGNPSMYPILTLSKNPNPEMFVVQAGDLDVNGQVSIALYHQGLGTGNGNRVYAAAPLYPFRMRLENIGAEPS